jgi:uncharacterized protein YndB with AHSA1/START domain
VATLHHQVWINAPVAGVYERISTAEGLGRWWAPHTSTRTEAGLVLAHDPGPAHGPVQFRVLERTANRRVEWEVISTHPRSSPASAWTGTRIAFEIEERDNIASQSGFGRDSDRVAVLEFRHSGWDESSPYFGFCNFAWGQALQLFQDVMRVVAPSN